MSDFDLAALWTNNNQNALVLAQHLYQSSAQSAVVRDRLARILVHHIQHLSHECFVPVSFGAVGSQVAKHLFSCAPSRQAECDVAAAFALQPDFPCEDWCRSVITGYQALERGDWVVNLSLAQKRSVLNTLSTAIRLLGVSELREFWQEFDAEAVGQSTPLVNGVRALLWDHRTAHLVYGLQSCKNARAVNTLVLALEQLADPQALPVLHELEPILAVDNWPLARLVGRAIHVIYQQNPSIVRRDLLLPSFSPPDDTHLVRTANPAPSPPNR